LPDALAKVIKKRRKKKNKMSTEVKEKRSTSTLRKPAPRYRVLLHNDDFNTMEYVVEALMKTVAGMTQPQAVNIMMEAHTHGIALVIACTLEHAEFYCETLRNHGLTSTIEPDE
jgi:ATP-dependent Clp protease adaptor protein ClpS